MTNYFEEKILSGVLHYRMKEDSIFMPYTAEQLTSKLVEASIAVQKYFESKDEIIDEGGDCCGA